MTAAPPQAGKAKGMVMAFIHNGDMAIELPGVDAARLAAILGVPLDSQSEESMTDPDNERGLYGKYYVRKIKQQPDQRGEIVDVHVDPGPCFVLAYTKDPHARVALAAYADSCEVDFPALAADLRKLLR